MCLHNFAVWGVWLCDFGEWAGDGSEDVIGVYPNKDTSVYTMIDTLKAQRGSYNTRMGIITNV